MVSPTTSCPNLLSTLLTPEVNGQRRHSLPEPLLPSRQSSAHLPNNSSLDSLNREQKEKDTRTYLIKLSDICSSNGCQLTNREGNNVIRPQHANPHNVTSLPKGKRLAAIMLGCWRYAQGLSHTQKENFLTLVKEIITNTTSEVTDTEKQVLSRHIYILSGENLALDRFLQWCFCRADDINHTDSAASGDLTEGILRHRRDISSPASSTDNWAFCNRQGGWSSAGGHHHWHFGYSMVPEYKTWPQLECSFPSSWTQIQQDIACADRFEWLTTHQHLPTHAFISTFKTEVCRGMTTAELNRLQEYVRNCGDQSPGKGLAFVHLLEQFYSLGDIIKNRHNTTKVLTSAEVVHQMRLNACKVYKQQLKNITRGIAFCEGRAPATSQYHEALNIKWQDFTAGIKSKYPFGWPVECENATAFMSPQECEPIFQENQARRNNASLHYFNEAFNEAECKRLIENPITTPEPATTPPTTINPTTTSPENELIICRPANSTGQFDWREVPEPLACTLLEASRNGTGLMQDISCADKLRQLELGQLRQTAVFDNHFNYTYCWLPKVKSLPKSQALCVSYQESLQQAAEQGANAISSLGSLLPKSAHDAIKRAANRGIKICELVQAQTQNFAARDTYCETGRATPLTDIAKRTAWQALADSKKIYSKANPPSYCVDDMTCYLPDTPTNQSQVPDDIKIYRKAYAQAIDLASSAKNIRNQNRNLTHIFDTDISEQGNIPAGNTTTTAPTLADNTTLNVTARPELTTTATPELNITSRPELNVTTTPELNATATSIPVVDNQTLSTQEAAASFEQRVANLTETVTPSAQVAPQQSLDAATLSTTARIVSGVAGVLTAGLTLVPTVRNERANFQQNKTSPTKLAQSGLRLLSAGALTAAPLFTAVGAVPVVGTVTSAVGTAAMVAQAPFVFADCMRFVYHQDASFRHHKGAATQYCHENAEADTGSNLASKVLRVGTQAFWTADSVMRIFGSGCCPSVWMWAYLPTLYSLLHKIQDGAFEGASCDASMLKDMAKAHLPALLGLMELCDGLDENSKDELLFILQTESRVLYQVGACKLTDTSEQQFFKYFFNACKLAGHLSETQLQAVQKIVTQCYSFNVISARTELEENFNSDLPIYKVLDCLLELRMSDKGYRRNCRGLTNANHVYNGVIATVMKILALNETQDVFVDAQEAPLFEQTEEDGLDSEFFEASDMPGTEGGEEIALQELASTSSGRRKTQLHIDDETKTEGACGITTTVSVHELRRGSSLSSLASEQTRLLAASSMQATTSSVVAPEAIPLRSLRSSPSNSFSYSSDEL